IRIYGAGAIALGLVGIAWRDFALQWQPVAASMPGRTALACVFAILLVLAGAAINWLAVADRGAAALVCLYGIVVVLMHGIQLIQHPGSFATWSGVADQLALLAAGVMAFAILTGPEQQRSRTLAQAAMGVCLLAFGIAHFVYLDFTATMVPAWIPGTQRFWAA